MTTTPTTGATPDPLTRPCEECGAEPLEVCRWACTSRDDRPDVEEVWVLRLHTGRVVKGQQVWAWTATRREDGAEQPDTTRVVLTVPGTGEHAASAIAAASGRGIPTSCDLIDALDVNEDCATQVPPTVYRATWNY